MESARQPLRDISTNSPSVKRQKTSGSEYVRRHESTVNTTHYPRDITDWQRSWRKIMLESVIYFDSNDSPINNVEYITMKKKAMKLFTQVGAKVQLFFDNNVTIVVSKRDESELPKNILQYANTLKFWKYDKVFRFLNYLGEISAPSHSPKHLSSLLNNEKLHGPSDRDPNAKRDDFYYFKYPYFFVYDSRQINRAVAVREWKTKDQKQDKKPWPHIFSSTYGRSLFQADPHDTNLPKKIERRKLRDQQNRKHRIRLRMLYECSTINKNFNLASVIPDSTESDSENDEESDMTSYEKDSNIPDMPPPPETLSRQPSLLANAFMDATKRDGYEIQASGFNGSTNVSQQSTELQTKNGLAPVGSSVASKQVTSLAKKLIAKQHKINSQSRTSSKQKISGYCENCRVHFEDFDTHIESGKHRSFAIKDSNFEDIDELIHQLNDNIAFKR